MSWIRAHPYAALFALAGVVLIIIAGLVRGRAAPPPSETITIATVGNGLLNPGLYQPTPSSTSTPTTTPVSAGPTSFSVSAPSAAEGISTSEILTALSPAPSAAGTQSSPSAQAAAPSSDLSTLLAWAYSFTPTPTTSITQSGSGLSPDQQALYNYGNAAGTIVEQFENANANMAQVLQNWVNARTNSSDAAAVNAIATGMEQAGHSLSTLPGVPDTAVSTNQALATAYENAGANLTAVVQAGSGSDASFANAMETYDASADTFTQQYVALSGIFSSYGVSFAASDPGSAFQFQGSGL